MRKTLLGIIFFLLVVASRAEGIGFNLDRAKVRHSIPPGGSEGGQITVENVSTSTLSLRVYAEDWAYGPDQDGSKNFYPAGTSPYSAANWITFSPSEFVLTPFSKKKVNYLVKVPPEASGGHYAVLFFEALTEKTDILLEGDEQRQRRAGIDVAVRLGSLFYIETKGKSKRSGSLSDFSVTGDGPGEPLRFSLKVQNTGDLDITAGGTYHLMDGRGVIHARGEFSDVFTLPGDEGFLRSEWKKPLPPGSYDVIMTVNLGKAQEEWRNFGRGPVMAREATLVIGQDGAVKSASQLR